MSLRSRMTTWWRAIFLADALDRQVSEELQFHIESYAEDLMRRGVPRDEALRRARAELGSVAAARENSRQAWGTRFFDELRGDLRHALRMLAKSPGFTAIAVGSLAIGIGANTVIFTAAQHMLLDRLNVPHPGTAASAGVVGATSRCGRESLGLVGRWTLGREIHVVFVSGVSAAAPAESRTRGPLRV